MADLSMITSQKNRLTVVYARTPSLAPTTTLFVVALPGVRIVAVEEHYMPVMGATTG